MNWPRIPILCVVLVSPKIRRLPTLSQDNLRGRVSGNQDVGSKTKPSFFASTTTFYSQHQNNLRIARPKFFFT